MKNIDRFENASQFLACYFHQDFSDQFEGPEEAVAQFIQDADHRTRANAVHDLHQIVAEFQGSHLDDVVLEIGCYYDPERHQGVPMREWLNQVIAEIERSLSV